MWIQFLLENAHFAIYLIAALSFFTVFWLYWDAWTASKRGAELFKFLGFLILSISFIGQAVQIESVILPVAFFNGGLWLYIIPILRITGYLFISAGVLLDPLEPHPTESSYALAIAVPILAYKPDFLYPMLAALTGLFYLRRATFGLESHLKKVALSFFTLSISEFLSLAFVFRTTNDIKIYNLVSPFGTIWVIQHIFFLIAVGFLFKWSFGYLFKRFNTQIFIILDVAILVIFLLTTVSFTSLLIKNIEDETLNRISTNVKVLALALNTKKAESLSDAQVVANNPEVINDLTSSDRSKLADFLENFLLTKKESFLIVTDAGGKVLARGEDRSRFNDSLSSDTVFKRAITGESASSIISVDSVLAPIISVRSAVPIKDNGKIVGVVISGLTIDNAFLDGIKSSTGLEASLYAGNVLSATTLLGQDRSQRPIGIKETDKSVNSLVLGKGKNYTAGIQILNKSYFVSYLPITDIDNNIIGMFFVGSPQVGVLQSAGRSIELTFVITAILLILSVLPSYFISKYLSNQLN